MNDIDEHDDPIEDLPLGVSVDIRGGEKELTDDQVLGIVTMADTPQFQAFVAHVNATWPGVPVHLGAHNDRMRLVCTIFDRRNGGRS